MNTTTTKWRAPLWFGICIPAMICFLLVSSASSAESTNHMELLLASLTATNGTAEYTNAVVVFQHPDNATLRLIMAEVDYIGSLEKKEDYAGAADRIFALRRAFELAGTNLEPLLPELRSKFLSGESVGASGWALVTMGENAWPILIQGLTNVNSRVQLAAVEAVASAKGTNAAVALPVLERLLAEKSPLLRIQTLDTIGKLEVETKLKTPLLIRAVENETNITAKCIAIKGLANLAELNENAIKVLQRAQKDDNKSVRAAAAIALQPKNVVK